jgi:hypothetical protein
MRYTWLVVETPTIIFGAKITHLRPEKFMGNFGNIFFIFLDL